MTNQRRFRSRSGFTLTELMVAITVIAILAGMLMAAVIPAMSSARRTAILMEMKQIEQAVENFKTHHGFYPPSFSSIRQYSQFKTSNPTPAEVQASANKLLLYINRIAPNNREGELLPVSTGQRNFATERRIDRWWYNIGQYIEFDNGHDLVFWLSGLLKNKQYPLTNGRTGLNQATSIPVAYDDSAFERDVFYEFKSTQLGVKEVDFGGTLLEVCANFNQQANTEAPFIYIDAKSYPNPRNHQFNLGGQGSSLNREFTGYYVVNQDGPRWENANTFQLFTAGLDQLGWDVEGENAAAPANPMRWAGVGGTPNPEVARDKYASDNLCNFCEGMLDRYLSGTFDSPAVK